MKRRQSPRAAVPGRPAADPLDIGRRSGRVMIIEDAAAPRRARVIGSLAGGAIQMLLDAVERGVVVLDLSQVDQVDDAAVRVLAGLRPERCAILGCPRWLELWLTRVRGGARHLG